MSECCDAAKKFFEYIDNELCKEDRKEFEKHMELCRSCFSRLEFEQLLRSHLKKSTNHKCPEKLKARIHDLLDKF